MKKRTVKRGRKSRYPLSFKRQVVRLVSAEGLSNREAQSRFNLSSPALVSAWYKKYSSDIEILNPEEGMKKKEDKSRPETEKRIKELEKALQEARLKITGLEMLIDIAEEELKIDIRKKSDTKQPEK